jgi:predicted DNA-binding transcriptional regulator AlpA
MRDKVSGRLGIYPHPASAGLQWRAKHLMVRTNPMSSDMSITFLRLPEVKRRTGLSRSTVYQGMADGTFPSNVPLRPQGRGGGAALYLWNMSSAAPVGILAAALPRFQKRRAGQVSSRLAPSLKTKWPATGTTLRSDEGSKSPCVSTRSIKSKRESPLSRVPSGSR